MTTGYRNYDASALLFTMQFARQQLCFALRFSKLSVAASVCCLSANCLQAQEKEPPRLFRGGLVQQLRSLTEDAKQSRTDEAPTKRGVEDHLSDGSLAIPKPRPANEKSRGGTPTETRSANLKTTQPNATTRPTAPAKGSVPANGKVNSKPRAASETHSNSSAAVGAKPAGSKSTRPAEMGIPVTNSKLANEARFQLNDKSEANGDGYSAKSKYDPAKSPAKSKESEAAHEDYSKVFNDSLKVQAVESMSQAPKVSRKPLPAGTVTKTATHSAEKPQEQTATPKPAGLPVGLKPQGGTYSLDQADAPQSKTADPAPKPTDYPSLQTPAFAAPGATNSKNTSGPSQTTRPANMPQFPTPPSSLQKSLPLSPAVPPQPQRAESQRTESQRTESSASGLPPSYPALLPNVSLLPTVPANQPTFNPPSTQVETVKPTATRPAGSVLPETSSHPSAVAPGTTNPIRTNAGSPSADEHMAMETPRLQVLLKGPHDMPVGTPADYQVLVRNVDDIPLDGVILRLEIPNGVTINQGKPSHGELQLERTPDGATLLTWSFADLAAHQNASAPLQLTAKSPRNFAIAMDWTLLPKTAEAQIEVRQAKLELAFEGPSEAEYGVANMYRLHVRNPGSAVAKNVHVKLGAPSFEASETQIPEILPGEQQSIDVELTFNEQGTMSIDAEADAAELHSAASISVLVKRASITAAITGSNRVYHGEPSSYEVRVQNAGDLDSRIVRAELTVPEGAEVLSKPSGATMVNNRLTWEIPSLKSGQVLAFPIELNLWTAGEHKLALATTTAHGQPSLASITTVVEAIADLKLVVNDPIAPAPVGGTVTSVMSITNRGSRAASNVRAVAQFSDGIEPIHADGGQHRIVTGQVIFEPLARIEAGETKVLRVQAKAGAAGTHRFRAEVRSDESDLRLVQEETTQYLESSSRIATPMNTGNVIR